MTAGASPAPEDLMEEARGRLRSAHAPYSGFRVAAALEAEDGRVFTGVNVENASYPVGMCAERVALGAAVTAGAERFRALAIVSSGERPVSPCGMCRQALSEFGTELEVWSGSRGDEVQRWTLRELLPDAFGRDYAAGPGGYGARDGGSRA